MARRAPTGGRRSPLVAAAATAVLAVVGVLTLVLGFQGRGGPPQPVAAQPVLTAGPTAGAATTAADPSPTPSTTSSAASSRAPRSRIETFLPASSPVSLEIPSVGIRSKNFVDLEVAEDGTLDVPGSADEVGSYVDGPTPGQLGPAVLGAHVDSRKGPGVFYRLGAVREGDKIHVGREDGTRVTFVVDEVGVYPKKRFPTERVYYGDFTRPEIRLVTCGGPFDPVEHYLSNVVVFGHRVR